MWFKNSRNQEIERRSDDQIEVFRILNGYVNIDRNMFVSVKERRRTRGHGRTNVD